MISEQISQLPKEDKVRLRLEFTTFHERYNEMRKNHGLVPDFELGAGIIRDTNHFFISKQHGLPHLILSDNAPFDIQAPTPIFYQLNKLAGLVMVKTHESQLRRF